MYLSPYATELRREEDSTILKDAYDALVLRFVRIYLPGLTEDNTVLKVLGFRVKLLALSRE